MNMIDLGAFHGEISFYFCRELPQAKILAIEASPENFSILKLSCKVQPFSLRNLILLNEAVADQPGLINVTRGRFSENSIIFEEGSGNTAVVQADTLASIMDRFGFESVDFLKIDIEGSESFLYGSLKSRIKKIKSVYMEINGKMSHQKRHLPIVKLFLDSGMNCYTPAGQKLETIEKIFKFAENIVDVWFIKS